MSYYREQLESWLSLIDVSAHSVLDIGGSANPVSKRVGSFNVKESHILDNNNEVDFHDKWSKPDILWDLNETLSNPNYKYKYDVIFCLEVFEYIYNPVTALKNILFLLKKGGEAYISFPFVYPHHNPVESDSLRYTEFGVNKLLKVTGFSEWLTATRVDKSGKLQEFYAADGMRPAKEYTDHSVTGFLILATK